MKLSISKKIMIITVASIIASSFFVLGICFFSFDHLLEEQASAEIQAMQAAVAKMQEQDKDRVLHTARLFSASPLLISAMQAGDKARIQEIAKATWQQTGLDAVTITDAKGVAVARGHSSRIGDDLSNRSTIQEALKGNTKVGLLFEPSAVVPFSNRCDAPIYAAGTLLGVASLAGAVGTEAHIDNLQKVTGMDITLFHGDTRLMTSLRDKDGKRAIGTKIQDAVILDRVLRKGETAIRKISLFGNSYNAMYWPVKDLNDKIIGMWFIGVNLTAQAAAEQKIVMIAVAGAAGVTLLLSLLASVLGRRIALPIRKATDYAMQVADGKLDAPLVVQSHDEVGLLVGALQSMVRTLQERISEAETISAQAKEQAQKAHDAKLEAEAAGEDARQSHAEIRSAAERLDNAVKVIRHASVELTECIQQAEEDAGRQAEYIAASAGAMTQMSTTAQDVATNATNAKAFSLQTREKASRGEKIVEDVIGSIHGVQKNSLALKADMTELSTHAKSISQIMNVISDIADQTNLLALNAAIEAARAGEAGRGFAVVADEVRKLAEKTMASTGDVSQAVNSIHKSMGVSMDQVGMTVTNIEQATELATQSGAALREIVSMAEDMARQVESIVAACEHQAAASEHVNRSIAEVNAIAGKTHTTMETASRDVADLAAQTDSLGNLVAEMKHS